MHYHHYIALFSEETITKVLLFLKIFLYKKFKNPIFKNTSGASTWEARRLSMLIFMIRNYIERKFSVFLLNNVSTKQTDGNDNTINLNTTKSKNIFSSPFIKYFLKGRLFSKLAIQMLTYGSETNEGGREIHLECSRNFVRYKEVIDWKQTPTQGVNFKISDILKNT